MFQISTTEGWITLMLMSIDSRGPYRAPHVNHEIYWIGYFIVYILVGVFFIANLCIGVIIDNFNQMKKEQDRSGASLLLTEAQHKWLECQKIFLAQKQFFVLTNLQSLPP